MQKIGVMTAMPEEMKHFCSQHQFEQKIGQVEFWRGKISKKEVVFASCGLGKVNAAQVACLLIHHFQCQSLLFSGIAGGLDPSLEKGDVVIAKSVICHDYGRIENSELVAYQPGRMPLHGQNQNHGYFLSESLQAKLESSFKAPALQKISEKMPQVVFGKILTGDTFLNCKATRKKLFDRYHAQAIEMEGAAIAQVCQNFNVPWTIVRSLSDLSGEESVSHFAKFLKTAAYNAALVSRQLIKQSLS